MNLLSFLSSVSAPKSLWVTLINWIQESVGNLGWTIILVTVLIKLVTTPLDFLGETQHKKTNTSSTKMCTSNCKTSKKVWR